MRPFDDLDACGVSARGDGKRRKTPRSVRDASVSRAHMTGVGLEDPATRDATRTRPLDAIDVKERIRVLRAGVGTYFGPSPGPKSSGRRFGCNLPDSLSEANISNALRVAWSMLKYLYEARRPTKQTSGSFSASAR